MQTFKDSAGRQWVIDLNFDARNEIKAKADIDILDLQHAQRLCVIGDLDDLDDLGRVLFVLCEKQITDLKLDVKDFARGLKGESFEQAAAALSAELIDFFLPAQRQIASKAITKARELQAMALTKADQILSSDQLDKQMQQLLNDKSGSSPALSESTPADSQSAS